jgi:phage terminase large subunit
LQAAAGKSMFEQLAQMGVKGKIVPSTTTNNSINAGRVALNNAWFDMDNCVEGVERLRGWRYAFSQKSQIFSEKPIHDHNSHASDAWCLLGRIFKGETIDVKPENNPNTATNIIMQSKKEKLRKLFND